MANRATNVYHYLVFLQKYLLGDLELFEKLSFEAEKTESSIQQKSSNKGCASKLGILFKLNSQPPTTTTSTTKNPISIDFGEQIVSRGTIPFTTSLFATIDVLGFLARTGQDFKNTTKNFKQFFDDVQIDHKDLELSILVKVYRHGIVHTYFPKLNLEISFHSENPIGLLFFKREHGGLVLNVYFLKTLVLRKLNDLISSPELHQIMEENYQYLSSVFERDCREEIDSLNGAL